MNMVKRGIFCKLLLKPEDFKPSKRSLKVIGVLNPGVIRYKDGKVLMYVRIAEAASEKRKRPLKTPLPSISHFRQVVLDESGLNIESIDQKIVFKGIPGSGEYGVEDPRFTKIDGKYYMTYVGVSKTQGVSTYLAVSKDLKKWKRLGLIFREQNKDVILFPEKIKGHYVAFNRPETSLAFSKPSIWISYSKDLIHWGGGKALIRPRLNSWESSRIGGGTPPIRTSKGWLEIYHGLQDIDGRGEYSAGALLLSLKNPENVIAQSPKNKPLFQPEELFEKKGFVNDVVFPTGLVLTSKGKELLIYSGGADSVITVRKLSLNSIFKHLRVK